MKITFIALLAMGLMACAAQAQEKDAPQKRDRQGNRAGFIKKYDKNGDGKLDEQERKAARDARQAEMIKKYDKNSDGKLDKEERKAAREQFRRNRGDRERQRNRDRSK